VAGGTRRATVASGYSIAEADTEWDPLYEDILEQGKWRTVTHDNDLQGFARALHRRFDFDSSGCYRNARLVMQDNRYWENDRVQYVEGIGLEAHCTHHRPRLDRT